MYIINPKTGKFPNNKKGKNQEVFINAQGNQYIKSDSGQIEFINQKIFEAFIPQILSDQFNNQFIISPSGEKKEVIMNEFGELCVENEEGFIVPVNQLNANRLNPLSQLQQQMLETESGGQFFMGVDGSRIMIQVDEAGKQYFMNSNGLKQV